MYAPTPEIQALNPEDLSPNFCGVWGSGFWVSATGFQVSGAGFQGAGRAGFIESGGAGRGHGRLVLGSASGFQVPSFGFRVPGFRCRSEGFGRIPGFSECAVLGSVLSGFRE